MVALALLLTTQAWLVRSKCVDVRPTHVVALQGHESGAEGYFPGLPIVDQPLAELRAAGKGLALSKKLKLAGEKGRR